ncbi:DUF4032 domain-containing protein [Flaviflexus equikiangi]|uniref:DUF4032 domain-containing protein n=1 Tax=Flaviflexus equikiangi TaxID=2758573 RepID=A0ABS2TGL3_9ACTO|nr:DUF4032 domain-containing protein [Flaviflexus equikiangi]MBM9432419.1 DUF4032 domain-containing protein [Flaviflexus equikiangi]
MVALQITAASVEPALFDLPWHIPLEEWPDENIAALPRGISRHVVRFAHLGGKVIAIKEIGEFTAHREYELLRDLARLEAPAVTPLAVVTGRVDVEGQPLQAVLVTEHLPYSLPYRAAFGTFLKPETADRLIDALSILLVRLHLLGFYWGDVSLSNTLFRRDAGEFAAYLVDAETGELNVSLSDGKRTYDIDVARTNIIGELMDLQAGGMLDEDIDVVAWGDRLEERYTTLWGELTRVDSFASNERWRVAERINRLNTLGFDVGELSMTSNTSGSSVSIQPKVVDAGHYHRQILRLTGLDVEENQARRLLNDLESYRALTGRAGQPLSEVAHEWMSHVFEPAVNAIPVHLRGRLQPAEMYHELLEHRWYMSEKAGHDVSMNYAVRSYIDNILIYRPDEKALLGAIIDRD